MTLRQNFLIITITLVNLQLIGCGLVPTGREHESQNREAERILGADPEYRKMDQLCKTIKVPDDSDFVRKARLFNRVGILYFYRSKQSNDEIEKFLIDELTAKGWSLKPNDLLSRVVIFQKDGIEVHSTIGGVSSDVTFSLGCAHSEPSVGPVNATNS